jgi:hypothetical protein
MQEYVARNSHSLDKFFLDFSGDIVKSSNPQTWEPHDETITLLSNVFGYVEIT